MNIPKQLIPLSKKNTQFIKDTAMALTFRTQGYTKSKKNDITAWNYFNCRFSKEHFKYLTHIGDYALPAKARLISIQRPVLNYLISKKSRRYPIFSVAVIDKRSIEKKRNNQLNYILEKLRDKTNQTRQKYEHVLTQIETEQQQLMAMLQQEPQNQEEAMMQQQVQQMLPQIQKKLAAIQKEIDQEMLLNSEDLNTIEKYLRYDYMDFNEKQVQKGIKEIIKQKNFRTKSKNFFIDKIVTGKGFFFVDYDHRANDLILENMDSLKVHYPSIESIDNVQDGPWVVLDDYIDYNTMVNLYGESQELTESVLKALEVNAFNSSDYTLSPSELGDNVYSGTRTNDAGINRKRIWWKSPRKVYFKYSPNKHDPNNYHIHMINDESAHSIAINTNKNEKLKVYYVNDLFHAVIIDNQYLAKGYRVEKPLRSFDKMSDVELPVIGKTHSSHSTEPYSLIWNTKDLQDLHIIVNLHRELYISASGVKGQIVDLSQKPGNMSIEEQRYHKKTGTLYIETIDKTGRKAQSHYNQWKDYDDTLSPNIQFLEGILISIENLCRETMGVNRHALGQTVPNDLVGTSILGRDQSSMITEILFHESLEVESMALRRATNLLAQYKWKDRVLFQLSSKNGNNEIVSVPENVLNSSEYDVVISSDIEDEQNFNELLQTTKQYAAKGMLPYKNLVEIYNMESMVELQKNVIQWSEEAQRLQQLNLQNEREAQMQAIQLREKLDNEVKVLVHKDKMQLEQLDREIKQAKLEMDRQKMEVDATLKNKELDLTAKVDISKIMAEREIEGGYLNEQTRNNAAQEQLRSIQLQLTEMQIYLNSMSDNARVPGLNKNVGFQRRRQKDVVRD